MISADLDICQAALRGQGSPPPFFFSLMEEIAALSSVITPAEIYLEAAERR